MKKKEIATVDNKKEVEKLSKMREKAIKQLKLKEIKKNNATRYSFSKIGDFIEIPNLIKVQLDSYNQFIEKGLAEVLRDVSPITDYSGNLILEFFDYRLEENTKYSLEETKTRSTTYSKRLLTSVRLINKETGEIKEQEIYIADLPIMTDSATFIINGAERVVVSQLVRSPGVYFVNVEGAGRYKHIKLYNATLMPLRGAWIEFETDLKGTIFARVDRTRKIAASTLIRALGIEKSEDIIALFGEDEALLKTIESDTNETTEDALLDIYKKLKPGELSTIDAATSMFNSLLFNERRYDLSSVGRFKYNQKLSLANRISRATLAEPIIDPESGEILFKEDYKLNYDEAKSIQDMGINRVVIKSKNGKCVVIGNSTVNINKFVKKEILDKLDIDELVYHPALKQILSESKNDEELMENIKKSEDKLFPKTVTREDIFATLSFLICLNNGIGKIDNIDHLGNRRVRSVGELLQNQFRIGFARVEKTVRERMTIKDLDTITPQSLINIKPIISVIREFFGSSQLSQFMDQTNPLSELTHKRRISALGPGGLSRERAGFEVRDVHYTHYGRLCPIESPEGQNVGLISALSSFARINKYGFIETPYRKIDPKTHVVTDEVVYMSSDVEDNFIIAQATEKIGKDGKIKNQRCRVRYIDEIKEVDRDEVDFIDVSPKQLASVAAALIPFLENDDARRTLMGSNMQRQAVPLIKTDSPIVGTGMEYRAALDSGVMVLAKNAGKVVKVTAQEIIIEENSKNIQKYTLRKFKRTNGGTCICQKPIVREGEIVTKGQVIADGMATQNGELALGKNVIVAFATWEGYNYEDAVLISDRLVKEDVFTSVHIEEYECETRTTKIEEEQFTRELPNVSDDSIKDLDERGIIRIGANVKAGDILVGKITPKGDIEQTAEEKLLGAIFGEKAKEYRDTSLRLPHGEVGTVVDVRVFNKKDCDELRPGVNELVRVYVAQKRKISVGDKMSGRHGNKGVISRVLPQEDMPYLADGTSVDIVLNPLGIPSRMNLGQVLEVHLGEAGRRLGIKFETPILDGATDVDIEDILEISGCSRDGKTQLYDGRTGEPFDQRTTVGIMYMLKLHHLVDDKIHARSIGTYSLVTQQPLGGKAQMGGQRFGEMEVWALEAYGAANTLQEMLTVKSDDVEQRRKTYEAIVKGENMPKPGLPEGFKVLVKELQGLGLNIELLNSENKSISTLESEEENPNVIKNRDEIKDESFDENEDFEESYDDSDLSDLSILDENTDDDLNDEAEELE